MRILPSIKLRLAMNGLFSSFINFVMLSSFRLLSPLHCSRRIHRRVSLYTGKPFSFSSTISAIPLLLKRLFITFLWVSLLMLIYNTIFLLFLVVFLIAIDSQKVVLAVFSLLVIFVLFLGVHVYMTAWWYLASVVSVLEPIYGIATMKKIYELLKGRTHMACSMVFKYLALCAFIAGVFAAVVVHGGDDFGLFTRIVVGGILVGILVVVNLVGLLLQSVFYYVCKSFYHQVIDKSALHDHLGGYFGDYVLLKAAFRWRTLMLDGSYEPK